MCGIFGVLVAQDAQVETHEIQAVLERLYKLSESRGKESAGLHAYLPQQRKSWTLKAALPATALVKAADYRKVLGEILQAGFSSGEIRPLALLAHSRLVTNGAAEHSENNQPVTYGSTTVIHNGIIVNADQLWEKNRDLHRKSEVDTEVLAALLARAVSSPAASIDATREVYSRLQGAASIAWVHEKTASVVLATNTGDLYYWHDEAKKILVFASERHILEAVLSKTLGVEARIPVVWLKAGNGCLFELLWGQRHSFALSAPEELPSPSPVETSFTTQAGNESVSIIVPESPTLIFSTANETLLRYSESTMRAFPRCARCVLPETFPFIDFDENGVCNYCRGYKTKYAGRAPHIEKASFVELLRPYRNAFGQPDVLVPFSGGRDSCYGLHLIKEEFGLTPITFTYDWGMVTDLARRNISRLCGRLGVPNILVSADLKAKRENIRKNVAAWLKNPDLGLVPLFMAGDKHFFKIVNDLKHQTGIRLDLWSANPLENTDFKSGFCGIAPDFDKQRVDYLSWGRKARMAGYYGLRFLGNPGYLNSSLADTAKAFASYYIEPRKDFFFMFNHVVWDEREVNKTIIDLYDFELSPDSPSTWRIGDGTAPFYNYIYMTARGFSEFDTFRSNQIREGMITREEALERILEENRPRVQSLRWYLETIGLDFNYAIKTINTMDTLGLHA